MDNNNRSLMYASEVMLSLTNHLPPNLVIDSGSSFPIKFLAQLSEDDLRKIKEEAKKKDPLMPLYLHFATKAEGSNECPKEFDHEIFDLGRVKRFEISGDTCDFLKYYSIPHFQYLSIVLIT